MISPIKLCLFVGEVKDYISRAEQLKQLLKPNHADTSDGAQAPHELGLYYKPMSDIYFQRQNSLHFLLIQYILW